MKKKLKQSAETIKKLNQKSGIIYITVVMMIAGLSVLALSVVSYNSNQAILVEKEIKKIQAEEIAFGQIVLRRAEYENALLSNPAQTSVTGTSTITTSEGLNFSVSDTCGRFPQTGPNSTGPCTSTITW